MREPTDVLPDEIANFLRGETHDTREGSWSSFLARHNRLLLRVAYAAAMNREDAMDAYAVVLEQLREHDGRRLRAYRADGRSKFTTWLVVVARSHLPAGAPAKAEALQSMFAEADLDYLLARAKLLRFLSRVPREYGASGDIRAIAAHMTSNQAARCGRQAA